MRNRPAVEQSRGQQRSIEVRAGAQGSHMHAQLGCHAGACARRSAAQRLEEHSALFNQAREAICHAQMRVWGSPRQLEELHVMSR